MKQEHDKEGFLLLLMLLREEFPVFVLLVYARMVRKNENSKWCIMMRDVRQESGGQCTRHHKKERHKFYLTVRSSPSEICICRSLGSFDCCSIISMQSPQHSIIIRDVRPVLAFSGPYSQVDVGITVYPSNRLVVIDCTRQIWSR
jgi:hypothetical protein